MSEERPASPFAAGFGSLLGIGVLLRVWMFLVRGALSRDEASLALNIVGRALREVARPFVYQQYAPYLYMVASKLTVLGLGPGERALRIWSLVAGCLVLPALLVLLRDVGADWAAGLFALALLVTSPTLLRFSSEFAPGASDALIAAGLCLLTWHVLPAPERPTRLVAALLVSGVVAPWCSLPAIVVLGGCVITLAYDAWRREQRDPGAFMVPLLLGFSALASFAIHELGFLRAVPADALVAHAPLRPLDLCVALASLVAPEHAPAQYLTALLWAGGMLVLWRAQRTACVLLGAPLVLTCLVSLAPGLRERVLADHFVLFALPLVIAPVALGLAALAHLRSTYSQLLAAAIAILLCLGPSQHVMRLLRETRPQGGVTPLVEHLREHYRAGDKLYVERQAETVYAYYARRAHFELSFPVADDRLEDATPSYETLDSLRGQPRVWVVTQGPSVTEPDARAERLVTTRLHAHGKAVDMLDGGSARLTLYDLSGR